MSLVWMICAIMTLVLQIIVYVVIRRVYHQVESLRAQIVSLETALRVRQTSIARQKINTGNPIIDARARTTKRDSNDLPATGRMTMGLKREKRIQ